MKIKPQYITITVLIGLIIVIGGLNLSMLWIIPGMLAFGFYMHRAWLKAYCKEWLEQYKIITGKYDKNGKRKG